MPSKPLTIFQIDGPRSSVSDVTTFEYYDCATGFECGRLQSLTNDLLMTVSTPDGVTLTYAYNVAHLLIPDGRACVGSVQ